MTKKTLLLTNDDGFLAEGIQQLKLRLALDYDIYVVAPDRERSAISMSLTIHQPLRVTRMADQEYAVNGTPVDCINIALRGVMPHWPDFIVSGMNMGENLCEDVLYSGTVAGAFTGRMYGVPALATSLIEDKKTGAFDFEGGAEVTADVLAKLMPEKNTNIVYNLNIPARHNGKIMVTSFGMKGYQPSIVERTDPRGQKYFWIGTGYPESNAGEGTDLWAVNNGHISLSALKYNFNDDDEKNKLTGLFNDGKK